jgi:hypothetical protein
MMSATRLAVDLNMKFTWNGGQCIPPHARSFFKAVSFEARPYGII